MCTPLTSNKNRTRLHRTNRMNCKLWTITAYQKTGFGTTIHTWFSTKRSKLRFSINFKGATLTSKQSTPWSSMCYISNSIVTHLTMNANCFSVVGATVWCVDYMVQEINSTIKESESWLKWDWLGLIGAKASQVELDEVNKDPIMIIYLHPNGLWWEKATHRILSGLMRLLHQKPIWSERKWMSVKRDTVGVWETCSPCQKPVNSSYSSLITTDRANKLQRHMETHSDKSRYTPDWPHHDLLTHWKIFKDLRR